MKCEKYEILINDLADGTISESDNADLQQHLTTCESCRKEMQQTLLLLDRVSALPISIEPDPAIWNNIESHINSNKVEFKQITGNYYSFQSTKEKKISESDASQRLTLSPAFFKYGIAAAILLLIGVFALPKILKLNTGNTLTATSIDAYWQISKIKGSPQVTDKVITSVDSVGSGQWIVTDDSSEAMLHVANLGSIMIDPKSKVQIISTSDGDHKIKLEYGTINAELTGVKPFVVETRSATAFDEGSQYTYTVDQQGDGIIYVKTGAVKLTANGRESLVPAGKICLTKTGIGPGTPYRQDASPQFRNALLDYDFKNGGSDALKSVLKSASRTDAITLLNLLPRVNGDDKGDVYSKLAAFVPPPSPISKDSIPNVDNLEELGEWMYKVQEEINKEIQQNMEKLNETIQKQIEASQKLETLSPEFQQELQEKINKYMEQTNDVLEKQLKNLDVNTGIFDQQMKKLEEQMKDKNWNSEYFDSEQFEREMERMGEQMERSMERLERDLERNSEQLERDLERQSRDLEQQQRDAERQQRDIERQQEQQEREIERQQRDIERQQEQIERDMERQQEQQEREMERQQEQQERQMEREQEQREREMEQHEREMERELEQWDN